jgi:hypothetical protein
MAAEIAAAAPPRLIFAENESFLTRCLALL